MDLPLLASTPSAGGVAARGVPNGGARRQAVRGGELQSWLARHAAGRLRARGEEDLARRAELVGLRYDERWDDPYWSSPSATN
ncbi:hypothetical protein [Streptomyces sp. AF1A]|jgi:hypothetical protein|uniref:hypothetical protein n=1 Tax=Streptomyces sp. AF1A TaxID=3394350 RepID=UPI0039BCDC33